MGRSGITFRHVFICTGKWVWSVYTLLVGLRLRNVLAFFDREIVMSTRIKKDEGLGKLSSLLEIKITIDTNQVPSNNEEILIQSFMRFRSALDKLSGEHKIDFFRAELT